MYAKIMIVNDAATTFLKNNIPFTKEYLFKFYFFSIISAIFVCLIQFLRHGILRYNNKKINEIKNGFTNFPVKQSKNLHQ